MPKSGMTIAEPNKASARIPLVFALFSDRVQPLFIAAVAASLYLFRLGAGALLDWDEAIHAEVSREILTGHHWLTLYWNHLPYFRKPPLTFWIRAGFFHLFGINEFWARFPSALAGVGVAVLTYAIARRLAGPAAGLLAAFVLMTTNDFDRVVREGTTDASLCLCIYVVVYAWMRLDKGGSGWFCLLCAAAGAGAMIKGPGVLIVFPAIGVDWIVRRKSWRTPPEWELCLGGMIFLSIVAPWHIWMAIHYGRSFWSDYFSYQVLERATRVIEGSGGGPWYYLNAVFHGAFPWALMIPIAMCRWIWKTQWTHTLIWTLIGIVFIGYTLVPTKHNWYILPVYPALAVEVGALLADAGARWRVVHYASVAVLAAGLIVAFIKLEHRRGDAFTNQVAQLAAMAGRARHAGPLLVIPAEGSDPQLDLPTAIFYSNRQAMLVTVPADTEKLAGFLKSDHSLDAVIQNGSLGELYRSYAVHLKAQNNAAAYAEISAPRTR